MAWGIYLEDFLWGLCYPTGSHNTLPPWCDANLLDFFPWGCFQKKGCVFIFDRGGKVQGRHDPGEFAFRHHISIVWRKDAQVLQMFGACILARSGGIRLDTARTWGRDLPKGRALDKLCMKERLRLACWWHDVIFTKECIRQASSSLSWQQK